MVEIIKKWLGIKVLDKKVDELQGDVDAAHNEYHDLEDTLEKHIENLQNEINRLKEETKELKELNEEIVNNRAKMIDEWLNGEEVNNE